MRILIAVAVMSLVGACTVGSTPCTEAADQLTTCSAEQRQAFIAACEESGGPESAELAAEDATAACNNEIAAGTGDAKAVAETGVCVAAMYAVKWTVTALSPTPQPLPAATKAALRPLFGSLVDQARITLGATLPPRVVIAGHELAVQPDAMTFGTHIFMLKEVGDNPTRLLLTTVHEMTHVQQGDRAGGFYGFAQSYCRDMIASGFDYNHIGMEVAAYGVQGGARHNLQTCGHVTCP